jgi:type IV secretory pathway TraG/TraD family ATPase VirD4
MNKLRQRIIKDAHDRGEKNPRVPTVMRLIETGATDAMTLTGPKADPEGLRSLMNVMSTSFLWIDTPTMEKHLCGFDFDFDMGMLKRVDNLVVFLVAPDTALESHAAYIRMALTCAANAITGSQWAEDIEARKYKINLIFDEFALYGRVPALERLFALGSGYGARCIIVSQNKTHVDKVYSAEGSAIFLANAAVVFLGGGDNETAAYFAEKCGETLSRDKETGEEGDDQVQVFTPQEILNLTHPDRDTGIYFESGFKPLRFRICVYHEILKAGVDFKQNIDHVRLRDKIQRPGQSPRLVSAARGYGDPTGKEDEPEHVMISDGGDNLPVLTHH